MLPLKLEGIRLGEKQKDFNIQVQDAISNKQFILTEINSNDDDIDNLFKIDIASKTRNVDYIIDVFKCKDMLYTSRAIKQSTWLITEQEYAHIINPEYLHSQLFPHMLTKAINKLLLHVRLHLKTVNRVEAFYDYLKDKPNETKWLLNCSTSFIENVIQNEKHIISLKLYKRLCKRSAKFLQYYTKVEEIDRKESLKAVSFLLNSVTKEYLKIMTRVKSNYHLPSLGIKATERIMKTSSHTILENFSDFINVIDISTFTKCIKREEIKSFLCKYLKNEKTFAFLSNYGNLKHFVKHLPEEEKFLFVKKIFIDNDVEVSSCFRRRCLKTYLFYQCAPFTVAFHEVRKLIRIENSPAKRYALFSVLITCAKNNPQYTDTLLQFYHDEHGNEPLKFKVKFINKVITEMSTHDFNNENWGILDKLFSSLKVYTDSGNNLQLCLKCIILYKILHDESIPDVIDKNVSFDTFKKFQSKLSEEQKKIVFSYLFDSMYTKLQNFEIASEGDFDHAFDLLENTVTLLNDWQVDLKNHSFIIYKIHELVKIKKQNSWSFKDLSKLYNINKSWRRHMFKESILLCPNEEVCLNALKHGPQMLVDHSCELDALRTDNTVSLRRLLNKLRVFWPHSLAQQWIIAYLNNLNKSTGHKSLFKGLFVLLSCHQVINIAKKYVPENVRIDWVGCDQTELSIRKNIAKHLHIARPLISLDVVLWYAKEDYFQHTIPSLNALLHTISEANSRKYLSKLLEASVKLRQIGLQLAFMKLKYVELIPLFLDIWANDQDFKIRTCLFNYTYSSLCKAEDPHVVVELWGVLKMFMDHLPADDNKVIFKKLCNLNHIHVSVRGAFYMKSYDFFTSLPAKINFIRYYDTLLKCAPNVMNLLDSDFVIDNILTPVIDKISSYPSKYINILTSYVLHGETEEKQCERFRKVLNPALKHAFKLWNLVINDTYIMKHYVDMLLTELVKDFCRFILLKRIVVPVKLFTSIKTVMEENICIHTNYILYTSWKLTTEITKLVAEHNIALCNSNLDMLSDFVNGIPDDAVNVWDTMIKEIAPKLGPIFVQNLREDIEKYFPTITWLFRDAFNKTFLEHFNFQSVDVDLEVMKYMLLDYDFTPSYLIVCHIISKYGGDHVKNKLLELREILLANPSQEVQFHYGLAFGTLP